VARLVDQNEFVMLGLVPGIRVFARIRKKDVDGRA
jgi:hypothetical protein